MGIVLGWRSTRAPGAVGCPETRVRDGYAVTGSLAFVDGQDTTKADAMLF